MFALTRSALELTRGIEFSLKLVVALSADRLATAGQNLDDIGELPLAKGASKVFINLSRMVEHVGQLLKSGDTWEKKLQI